MVKKNRIKGKKGNILDILYYMIILFSLAAVAFIMLKVVGDTKTNMQDDNTINSQNIQMITDYEARAPTMTDQLFIFVLIGLGIVTLISAALILSHPIFYVFMIIIMSFITWLSAVYANVYQELASDAGMAAYADQLTMSAFIMQYFPLTIISISIIVVIVMVAKR